MLIPHLLISISLLLVLNFVSLPDFASLLAGHVLICTPFTVAGIIASLDGVDAQLETAAMTLGASRLTALIEVVVPLVAPGVLSAFLFAFVVSFGDVYIALFLAGPGTTTLPIEIFSYVQWDSSPVIAAITSVQIMMIVVLGLAIEKSGWPAQDHAGLADTWLARAEAPAAPARGAANATDCKPVHFPPGDGECYTGA